MRNKAAALKERTGGDVKEGAADASCSCASIFNKRLKCETGG